MPTLSVTMPVYNAAGYVRESAISVLQQTFSDLEFIVIDDGSTDGSGAILDALAAGDSRMRVVHRENRGITATRNEMLVMCRGEFVANLDSDDVVLPACFERQIAFLRSHPDVVCVGVGWEFIDEKGRLLTRISPKTDDASLQQIALSGRSPICNSGVMMRLDAVRRAGGYDPEFRQAEDMELFLRLGEIGKLANLPEPLVRWRIRSESISGQRGEEQQECARRACEKAWTRRGITGRFEAGGHWRPGSDRRSRQAFMLKYGWWAFGSGESRTAAVYGLKAIAALPWKPGGWVLLLSALFKRAPRS